MAEKNDVKTTLRLPSSVLKQFKKIADEEGLSDNSALVQGLVWALKFREKISHVH